MQSAEPERPPLDHPIVLDFVRDGSRPAGHLLDADDLDHLYAHPRSDRGWVRTNFVSSVDGSASGDDGRSGSINTPSDHQVFATLRAHADVVLVGAGTVRAEGYRAVDLEPWQVALRTRLGLRPFPLLAVITSSLAVDPGIAPTDPDREGPVLIMTAENSDPDRRERLRAAGADVVTFAGDTVEVDEAVRHLARNGFPSILCEGGAGLHHRLVAAGLGDELCLTLSARLVGGDHGRILGGQPMVPNVRLDLAHLLHSDDGALFTRYLSRR